MPYPEAVFDISYFVKRPEAFYTLADELYPTKFKPTPFHVFMKLIENKGYLCKVFTQNIDTLERIAGVDGSKVVEAHGSFAKNHCVSCRHEMSVEELKRQMYGLPEEIEKKPNLSSPPQLKPGQKVGIPHCKNPRCKVPGGGLVKPDIVFFGEGLPEEFFEAWEEDLPKADLAIIAGTSLTVSPFSSLPDMVKRKVPRLLFNMEEVGTIGSRSKDVLSLGSCDDKIREFCRLCGWEDELETLLKDIHAKFDETYRANQVSETGSEKTTSESDSQKKKAVKVEDRKESNSTTSDVRNEETAAQLAKEIAERVEVVISKEGDGDGKKNNKNSEDHDITTSTKISKPKPKDDAKTEQEIDQLTEKIDKL